MKCGASSPAYFATFLKKILAKVFTIVAVSSIIVTDSKMCCQTEIPIQYIEGRRMVVK